MREPAGFIECHGELPADQPALAFDKRIILIMDLAKGEAVGDAETRWSHSCPRPSGLVLVARKMYNELTG